ncbi:hypothetical protein Tco_0884438 [Tanacetum coccineum]
MSTLPPGRRDCRPVESSIVLPVRQDYAARQTRFSTTYIHPKSCRNISANPGECEDEFEGRTTTLGVTLIMAIGGLWRATSTNLVGIFVEYPWNHRSKGIPWRSCLSFRNGYFELVSEYLKDLEECMDEGESKVAKEAKIQSKARSLGCGARPCGFGKLRYRRSVGKHGFMRVNFCDYGRKMVNDVNVEIHGVKFKADFVVLDYVNEGEPSIMFGRDFLVTTKSQVDFGLGEIRMNQLCIKELAKRYEVKKRSYGVSANLIFDLKTPLEQ